MKVEALYLYPVKSLAGVAVNTFAFDDVGPIADRRWMIIDEQGEFVTQRSHPELARVRTSIAERTVSIAVPGEGEFALLPGSRRREVGVWRDRFTAVCGADEAADALSRFCDTRLSLVYMADDVVRRVDPGRVPEYRRVSFADGFPLLVTNRSSLDELNARLEQPAQMERFRPNIVVSGAQPWEEDEWSDLKINDVSIRLVKPCSRCIVTTVDPQSGMRSPSNQPLKTLATYRRTSDGVIFGVNGIQDGVGSVSVGDRVSANPLQNHS